MPDCNRIECPQCLPLFRYFVNQQEAVFNDAQTITPECPIGYRCDPAPPILVPAEEQKAIPDLPPYDPDIDPVCDYVCEVNIIRTRDIYGPLHAIAYVGNEEQVITCEDVDLDPTGSASITVPKDTIILTFDPRVTLRSTKQAEANQRAFELGKVELLADIALGVQFCTDPSAPMAIWQSGLSESAGDYTFKNGDPIGDTVLGAFESGEYFIESDRSCELIELDPPIPGTETWYNFQPWSGPANPSIQAVVTNACLATETVSNIGAWLGSYSNGVSCVSIVGTADGLINVNPLDAVASTFSMRKLIQLSMVGLTSTGDMTLNVTRLSKPILSGLTLQSAATNWGVTSSIPLGSYWAASGDPAYPGTFLGFEYFGSVLNWTYNTCGGYGPAIPYSFEGKTMTDCRVKWVDDLDPEDFGQPAGPNISGWMIELKADKVAAGDGIVMTAFKISGLDQVGDYVAKPDATNHAWETFRISTRAATTIALPASTNAAGVLTADANGDLPAIDGVTLAPGDRVVVKNEAAQEDNGVYEVTDVGSAGTPWILTRHTTLDTDLELQTLGGFIWSVLEGTTNRGFWYLANEGTTINTDPITFSKLTIPIINIISV